MASILEKDQRDLIELINVANPQLPTKLTAEDVDFSNPQSMGISTEQHNTEITLTAKAESKNFTGSKTYFYKRISPPGESYTTTWDGVTVNPATSGGYKLFLEWWNKTYPDVTPPEQTDLTIDTTTDGVIRIIYKSMIRYLSWPPLVTIYYTNV